MLASPRVISPSQSGYQRLIVVVMTAGLAALALNSTGADVLPLLWLAGSVCETWAGTVMTLSWGYGLGLLPGAAAVIRRHPRLNQPLVRPGATEVSGMQRFWPLITAYWTSERWVEAWSLTAAMFAITTLISKSSVWVATATANFLSAIVSFHSTPDGSDPVAILTSSIVMFAAVNLGRHAATGVRHFSSNTLHRKARRWTQGQFSAALLGRNHIAMSLMSNRDGSATAPNRLPDNIDQRIDECTVAMYSGIIGLAMGLWGAITSIYFVSIAILERSVEVPFLERWFATAAATAGDLFGERVGAALTFSPGAYGSGLLVAVLVIIYVPLGTFCAWLIGRVLQRQTLERQACEATWRSELTMMLSRSDRLAISNGQRVQERVNGRLYTSIDDVWHRMNITQSGNMAFNDCYDFLSKRLVAYLPALPGYLAGTLSFRRYSAISELAAQLIDNCSWFIQVMPAIVNLKAHAIRLTEVASAIEVASDKARFHGRSGVHTFRHTTQDPRFGLTLKSVALHHRGHDAAPFVNVPEIHLRPGQWGLCPRPERLRQVEPPEGDRRAVAVRVRRDHPPRRVDAVLRRAGRGPAEPPHPEGAGDLPALHRDVPGRGGRARPRRSGARQVHPLARPRAPSRQAVERRPERRPAPAPRARTHHAAAA